MSAPRDKVLSITVHTSAGPKKFVPGQEGVKTLDLQIIQGTGEKQLIVGTNDGRFVGWYGFPLEVESEPQSILLPVRVELT
jgi:hypothetical protein